LAEARSAAVQVQELSTAIAAMAASVEGDPARLEWLETRKAALRKVKRTYGGTVESAREALEAAHRRREDLLHRGERLAELDAEHAAVVAELEAAGGDLRKARSKAAIKLAKAITDELRVLGFEHGAFAVELSPCEPTAAGMDEVEFGFQPNVGEPMRPLRAIASSGEISRVMLATKAVLASHDRIPVLVFDEVDANLGGTTGHAVGAKLAVVASSHQVLCITHLPQVAVHGSSHFVVSKSVTDGRTRTQICPVDDEARVEEVARMLGGRDLTSVTLDHARELLKAPAKKR
jgi:DNA repair protein RecN (Recombination protein N)